MRKLFWLLLLPVMLIASFVSSSCIFPLISGVEQVCGAPGMVDATFHWLPSTTGGTQYLDISWYSDFPANGFITNGPFDPSMNAVTVPGLRTNTIHHWRVNAFKDGTWFTSAAGTFATADCGTGDGSAPATGLRLIIPKIGVNAPVNYRVMGADGAMGIPNGKDDVVWYDFENFGGMGGFPGIPGANALFSGHVDYHPHYTAVFWDLRQLVAGDEIDVQLLDGTLVRYVVQWTTWIGDTDNFGQFAVNDGVDELTIVTCIGTFDSSTHNYSNRFVVRALRFG
jgi:LPXTG-site transpeptidase (sortase) family protein